MFHLQNVRWLVAMAICLTACSSPNGEKLATGLGMGEPAVAFQDTAMHTTIVPDTLDFFPLLSEGTFPAFMAAQGKGFSVTPDTVINDERGVFMGQRLRWGHSYIQWLDSNKVTHAYIVDANITLTHGLRVGMTKHQVQQYLGLSRLPPDTLSFDTGYMSNHCTLFFHQNRLHTVALEDMPD